MMEFVVLLKGSQCYSQTIIFFGVVGEGGEEALKQIYGTLERLPIAILSHLNQVAFQL